MPVQTYQTHVLWLVFVIHFFSEGSPCYFAPDVHSQLVLFSISLNITLTTSVCTAVNPQISALRSLRFYLTSKHWKSDCEHTHIHISLPAHVHPKETLNISTLSQNKMLILLLQWTYFFILKPCRVCLERTMRNYLSMC